MKLAEAMLKHIRRVWVSHSRSGLGVMTDFEIQ
jgi:hypothetical protein